MMLVIAVIAVIAAVALMSYRSRAEDFRITKSSLQIQHVLEAALAYYVDKGVWPDNNLPTQQCNPSTNSNLMTTFVESYLPNEDYQSSLGGNYCWGQTGANNRLFWVAVAVPNNDTQFAARLAAKLPNAIYTSDPTVEAPDNCVGGGTCYVRAEVTETGASASTGPTIQAAGYCETGKTDVNMIGTGSCADVNVANQQQYTVTFKACPASMIPKIIANPNFTDLNSSPTNNHAASVMNASSSPSSCISTPDNNNNETCSLTAVVDVCTLSGCKANIRQPGINGAAGLSYLVLCVPRTSQERYL